jgi:hypothetical protein
MDSNAKMEAGLLEPRRKHDGHDARPKGRAAEGLSNSVVIREWVVPSKSVSLTPFRLSELRRG